MLALHLRAIVRAGNYLIVDMAVQQSLRKKEAIGIAFLMCFRVPL